MLSLIHCTMCTGFQMKRREGKKNKIYGVEPLKLDYEEWTTRLLWSQTTRRHPMADYSTLVQNVLLCSAPVLNRQRIINKKHVMPDSYLCQQATTATPQQPMRVGKHVLDSLCTRAEPDSLTRWFAGRWIGRHITRILISAHSSAALETHHRIYLIWGQTDRRWCRQDVCK